MTVLARRLPRRTAPAGEHVLTFDGASPDSWTWASPPHDQLTAYERRVIEQVVSRAAGRGDVPARALSDGFAGPASTDLMSAKDRFMDAFTAEVRDDSRRRGLSRQRLSEAMGCLLWVAAAVPAVKGEKLTPAGRAALDRWRASADGRRVMAPVMSPGWPDRPAA
jgi:hypothetical protein